ncbi:serine hydrolase domain-containing protein [Pseudonocardia endophytica]|uniref:CubicO group peptidase (Beta-lactamase class C family) n=1 Tax=Pseudonocardia endophytica TaxID=401976 RepID=A0A4R1HP86_PSEEN|nr:serine hydrolase domain-containing protein [Pseudonocardia endophytica]TCK22465.1 CubicO group peptidase (beta-lactamase class C family) [Pseudonocardia endophytica]
MPAMQDTADHVLTRHLDAGTVPGAITAVVRGGDVTVDVRGTAGPGGTPLRRDTIVRIASLTKPVVAAAAMALVEDGVLDLDDRVDRWLPELADRRVLRHEGTDLDDTVPARRPITVEDLMSLRLGIGVLHVSPARYPIQHAYSDADLGGDHLPGTRVQPEPDEWMRRLGGLPLIAQPGERWIYHTGSDVLGVLLARATGTSLGDLLAERIFAPLGMRDTGFHVPASVRHRFCPLLEPSGAVLDPVDGAWSAPPAFESGGGGLVSTVDDLLAFAGMLRDGGGAVLAPCSVSEMTTDRLTDAQHTGVFPDGEGWGLGVGADDRGRYGWVGGTGVAWLSDPAHDTTSLLLTPTAWTSPDCLDLLWEFRAAVHG